MPDEEICCPKFDPEPWQEKAIVWEDKQFIMATIPQFMHMPIGGSFPKTVAKMWAQVEAADARPADKDFMMLAHDPSPWKSELYINVTKQVPDAENVRLSGKYLTKVFDGPYKDIGRFFKEMDAYVAHAGHKNPKYFVYYTTCPKCAEKYGHNYMVFFAQVA